MLPDGMREDVAKIVSTKKFTWKTPVATSTGASNLPAFRTPASSKFTSGRNSFLDDAAPVLASEAGRRTRTESAGENHGRSLVTRREQSQNRPVANPERGHDYD